MNNSKFKNIKQLEKNIFLIVRQNKKKSKIYLCSNAINHRPHTEWLVCQIWSLKLFIKYIYTP